MSKQEAGSSAKKLTAEYLDAYKPVMEDLNTAVIRDGQGEEYEISFISWRDGELRRQFREQSEAHVLSVGAAPIKLPNGMEFAPTAAVIQDADHLRFRVVDPQWTFPQWLQVYRTNVDLWNAVWDVLNEVDGLYLAVEAAKNASSAAGSGTSTNESSSGTLPSGADSE